MGCCPSEISEPLILAYLNKGSEKIQLFSQLKANRSLASLFLAGFQLKFHQGSFMGYLDSNLRLCSILKKQLGTENAGLPLGMEVYSMVDFRNATKPCNFGLNFNVGTEE